jgi:hypothetical protein
MQSASIAAGVMGIALLGLASATGCPSDSCTKDTDCPMPQVCIKSVCVPVGSEHDVSAPDDFARPADGTEVPPADADADPGEEGTDDASGDEGVGEVEGGCAPSTSTPLVVLTPTAASEDERPVVIPSEGGFVFMGLAPGTTAGDGLRFQRFHLDGSVDTTAVWTVAGTGVEIGSSHPVIPLPDGTFASAFWATSAGIAGIWVKLIPRAGNGPPVPQVLPGTDTDSGTPTVAFDGTDVIVAWVQPLVDGTIEIRAQHVNATTGGPLGSFTTVASGLAGTREPRIVRGGGIHALAHVNASDGAVRVLTLQDDLTTSAEHVLAPVAGDTVVGYPALAWSGSVFGLAWETSGPSSSVIHLATFAPGETPADHQPLGGGVPLSATETGELALAWNDRDGEWGIAWRQNLPGRVRIALVRIDADDFSVLEGPVDMRVAATTARNPSLACNAGYYAVTWSEVSGTDFPVFLATHGCSP